MNQSQTISSVTEKIIGGLPESKLEFKPQKGYEAVYGSPELPSSPRQRRRYDFGWCNDSRSKYTHWHSLAATSIFCSGGVHLVSSIGLGPLDAYGTHIQFCWFIAVIIGASISASLAFKVSQRFFNFLAAVLVIVSGIPYILSTQCIIAIYSARYCNGIAFGLTLIPAILAGSEQSIKGLRGFVLSIEQIGLVSGAILQLIYSEIWGNSLNHQPSANPVQGILAIVYGLLALAFVFFLTVESPVFLLRKNDEEGAINALRNLQKPPTITNETYDLLNECKSLLEEDATRGTAQNVSNSWIPMIKVIIFRCFVSMSFSLPLTMILLLLTWLRPKTLVGFHIYLVMRLIGAVFSMMFLDCVGRRIPSALSLVTGGGILFIVGWLSSGNIRPDIPYIPSLIFLMLIYQLLSGISAPTSTCYMGEAFSVSVKPYFVLAAIVAENILQIIICCLITRDLISIFACALGVLQVLYAIVFFFTMPETMETTLREALQLFQTILVVQNEQEE